MIVSYSRIKNRKMIIGFKNYDLVVDSINRKMIPSKPRLDFYMIKANNKFIGGQKIIRSMVDKSKPYFIKSVLVPFENFKEVFKENIKEIWKSK